MKTNFSKDCVRGICLQRSVEKLLKRGPKPKLRLKRKIRNFKNIGAKINCKKIDKFV